MIRKYLPNDPMLTLQWHLAMVGRLGFAGGVNTQGLERIWADYTGAGIHVGIWDEGVQKDHWDLLSNYDASRHLVIANSLNDGQPGLTATGHGTAAAGLIGAAANGQGGVGVAFGSSLTGVRVFGGTDDINTNWARYLLTLDHLGDFDITNHSYGRTPSFTQTADVARFEAAAISGRGGLGSISIKAAGNSNINGNGDAADASRFTITVAALTNTGQVANYSNYGAHILVSAPAGAVTTDLLGADRGYGGLDQPDYTNRFSGTSAATPVVSGVVALMLDANEALGWRDVQDILAYSALGTGSLYSGVTTSENAGWLWNGADNWNGGGLHYSTDYGYGMVNAFYATRMAEVWGLFGAAETSGNEVSVRTGMLAVNEEIEDRDTLQYSFTVSGALTLDHVSLTLNFTHSDFTDLRIFLVSPDGTRLTLADGSSGNASTSDSRLTYSFGIDGLRGEMIDGTWRLEITDAAKNDSGYLYGLELQGFGVTPRIDDVFHYTDEILTVLTLNRQSARMLLTDADGGTDWIDAAAMVGDLVLNLAPGLTSTLGGTSFLQIAVTTLIENAVGGDGNDRISGNDQNNRLSGMRGDDTLEGGAGSDTAFFYGNSADYEWHSDRGLTYVTDLSGRFGSDLLHGFEFLQFSDRTVSDPSVNFQDAIAPRLLATSPADNATGVAAEANLTLIFDEALRAGAGIINIYDGADHLIETILAADSRRVTISGSSVEINPTAALPFDTTCYVTISDTAFSDLYGNSFAGIADRNTFNFNVVSSLNTVNGTTGNDRLTGTAQADLVVGLQGNDRLTANGGNDVLDGGLGADSLLGGYGDDTYLVDSTGDTVSEGKDQGIDTVQTALSRYVMPTNVENFVYLGNLALQVLGNAVGNNLMGGAGNDTLLGLAGNDTLRGGGGADQIAAGIGLDLLTGGAGADRFTFNAAAEAGLGVNRDVITDFVTGVDLIDLSPIDANSSLRADQAFNAVFSAAFTGVKGQLVLTQTDSGLLLAGDINGDRRADFELSLLGISTLAISDIIL